MSLPHDMFEPAKRKSLSPKKRAQLFLDHAGTCVICGVKIYPDRGQKWHVEHIIPLADYTGTGDPNGLDNLGPAHDHCARGKTSKEANSRGKMRRQGMKHLGVKKERRGPPMPGSRASRYKKKIGGGVVLREEE